MNGHFNLNVNCCEFYNSRDLFLFEIRKTYFLVTFSFSYLSCRTSLFLSFNTTAFSSSLVFLLSSSVISVLFLHLELIRTDQDLVQIMNRIFPYLEMRKLTDLDRATIFFNEIAIYCKNIYIYLF